MSQSRENILVLKELTKSFPLPWKRGRLLAVRNLNLTIPKGEVFGLLGPNGSGKSTTMKLILGLLRPDSGKITVNGHDAGTMDARRAIGFLPENPYFPQFLTAREILRYYGALCGLRGKFLENRADEMLKLVGLEGTDNRTLRTFSKGMFQRIGLAQALINDPEILLLDEPTAGVDPLGARQIQDLILQFKSRGKTVIFSSHLLGHVQDVADRVAILHLGEKKCEGTLDELLSADDEFEIHAENLSHDAREEIISILKKHNAKNPRVTRAKQDLEDLFIKIVSDTKKSCHCEEQGDEATSLREKGKLKS